MTLRNLLLRAYPRSWRDEYGEELAGVLAQKRLTLGVVADVVGNGAKQHLYRDEPWKICGAGLVLWNSADFAARYLLPYPSFLRLHMVGFLFLFVAGGWTVLRKKSGVWRSTAASAKAALAGLSPEVVAGLWSFPHQRSTPIYGHSPYYWIAHTLVVDLNLSLWFGFAGAALARLFLRLRKEPREA
jgi:hypothetical protein